MTILEEVKAGLRITTTNTVFDAEITRLISAAKLDLGLFALESSAIVDTDPLIGLAVVTYCKSKFGLENPDSEKYYASYEQIKSALSMATGYKPVIADV